jgi:polysaccharide pyruvyl transferase WcaK-like protein
VSVMVARSIASRSLRGPEPDPPGPAGRERVEPWHNAGVTNVIRRRLGAYGRAATRRVADPLAYMPWGDRPPTNAPAVGLVGFYGWGNYGDELFGEVFREHLADPIQLHTVLNPDAGRFGRRVGAAVRRADALVIGGGDIVIPWATSSQYWERAYLRRPVFITGVGVPTFRESRWATVTTLGRFFQHPNVRYIGTRDATSSAWIERELQPAVPVVTAPDLVCGLTLPPVVRPTDPPIFGVAVRQRAEPDDLTQVRRLCERAISLGYRVRRIVLATGRTRLRDLEATAGVGLPDTELVSSDDLAVISQAIGECTVVASMKFHGVVVATMYGVPAFVLMPTAKNQYFVRDIGRPDLLSRYSDPDLPDRLTHDVAPISLEVRQRLRTGAVEAVTDLRRRILETASAGT